MQHVAQVVEVLSSVLGLGERSRFLDADSPLLGAIPELDSMAVVNVITALEERFDIAFHDDEIDGDLFRTVGSLADFVARKAAG